LYIIDLLGGENFHEHFGKFAITEVISYFGIMIIGNYKF